MKLNQLDDAMTHYRLALRLQPGFGAAHYRLAQALQNTGRHREAVTHYENAMRLKPDNPLFLNGFAWLRATCAQRNLRNATEAVRLAEQACTLTGYKNPLMLNTLGAAYAEAGRTTDAIHTAQTALHLLMPAGDQEALKQELRNRLTRYRQAVH